MPASQAGDALIQSQPSWTTSNFVPAGHGAGSGNINATARTGLEGTLASLELHAQKSQEEISAEKQGYRAQKILDQQVGTHSLRSIRSGLPPTPPSQDGKGFDEPLLSPSMLSELYQDEASSPRMQVSTPVQLAGPPTPDNTPPSTRDRLTVPRKELVHYPSLSQADSFHTARETLRSQLSNRSQTQFSTPDGEPYSKSPRPYFPSLPGSYDGTSDPVTPRANGKPRSEEPSPSPRSRKSMRSEETGSLTEGRGARKPNGIHLNDQLVSDRGTDSSHSRNPSANSVSKSDTSAGRKPRHRMRIDSHTPSNQSKDSLRHHDAHDQNGSHDALYNHLRDEKSKRLSAHSTTSTVVEAIVYTSPQKPHRGLRHAGKNLALRGDTSNLSRRNFSDTTELHEHRLRHRKCPLPGRGFGLGHLNEVEEKPRSVSSPEVSRRIEPEEAAGIPDESPKFAVRTLSKPAKRLTPPDWPLRSTAIDSTQGENNESDDESSVRSVKHNVLRRRLPVELTDDEDEEVSSRQSSVNHPRLGWRRDEGDDELASPPLKPPTSFGMLRPRTDSLDVTDNKLHPFRSHSGSEGGLPRASFDGSSRRGSLEPRMDHAHARHHSSAHTPLSEHSAWSDRTHTAEVNQARAVNIYPHHNDSLLIVQHPTSQPPLFQLPHDFPSPEEEAITPPRPTVPKFEAFLDTGTPPPPSDPTQNSPLTNPRTAPAPPAIHFIPATPASEPDRQLTDSPGLDGPFSMNSTAPLPSTGPKRRGSLRDRARAQSSALVDALLSRGGSVRSNRARRRNTVHNDGEEESRDRNLHPFWRPRGFWEGFDSEDEDGYEFEEEAGGRLPRGGDTSDVEEVKFPRRMSTRLPRFGGKGQGKVGARFAGLQIGKGRSSVPGQEGGTMAMGVRKRRSEVALRTLGATSRESLRRGHGLQGLRLGMGKGVALGPWRGLRDWSGRVRERREEKRREERRQRIRGSIGQRWLQDTSAR